MCPMAVQASALENPLREGLRLERTPEPCAIVIFGATGDLTRRKLVPALYALAHDRLLPANFATVGFARRDWDDNAFRGNMKEAVEEFGKGVHSGVWESFEETLYYSRGEFNEPAAYERLAAKLKEVDKERGTAANRVFYLATAPE